MRTLFSMLAAMMALTAYSQDTTNYYKSARLKENARDNMGAIADFTQYNQIRTDLQIEIPQIGTLDAYIVVPTASLPSPADRARRDVHCENLLAA